MTNYNERLAEILFESIESAATYTHNVTAEEADYIQERAKQAITSLTKELVAEAMPEPGTNLNSCEAQMFIISSEEYRQNLLKALEEV